MLKLAGNTGKQKYFSIKSYFSTEETNLAINKNIPKDVFPCPDIYELYPEILPILLEKMVYIRGNINNPGVHILENNTEIKELVSFAGGNYRKALISPDRKIIDFVSDLVTLSGSVKTPSSFYLESNQNLSSILYGNQVFDDGTYPLFALLIEKFQVMD